MRGARTTQAGSIAPRAILFDKTGACLLFLVFFARSPPRLERLRCRFPLDMSGPGASSSDKWIPEPAPSRRRGSGGWVGRGRLRPLRAINVSKRPPEHARLHLSRRIKLSHGGRDPSPCHPRHLDRGKCRPPLCDRGKEAVALKLLDGGCRQSYIIYWCVV
jgi:hypothetical protein